MVIVDAYSGEQEDSLLCLNIWLIKSHSNEHLIATDQVIGIN